VVGGSNIDVSRHIYLDIYILSKSNMSRRKYRKLIREVRGGSRIGTVQDHQP
jgi:hypothetical protein